MTTHNESGRLAWLAAAWGSQRHRITRLLGRIGDLGVVQGMKPKTFMKLLRLLEQVAAAKAEEVRIISEIDAIERKHRFNRKLGLVKRVGAEEEDKAKVIFETDEEKECDNEYMRPGLVGWWAMAHQLHGMLAASEAIGETFAVSATAGSHITNMPTTISTLPTPASQKQSNNWLLWLVVLWFLLSRPAIAPRSQALTAD